MANVAGIPWCDQQLFNQEAQNNSASWSASANLPVATGHSHSFVGKDRVYLFGGYKWNYPVNTVYTASIDSVGVIGTWASGTALPIAVQAGQLVKTTDRVYILGGIQVSANVPGRSALTAPINSDGTIGAWTQLTNFLPEARAFHGAVVTTDKVYLLGGVGATNTAVNTTIYTTINPDGTLDPNWTGGPTLPSAITRAAWATIGDRVYCFGAGALFSRVVIHAPIDGSGLLGAWVSGEDGLMYGTAALVGAVVTTKTHVYLINGQGDIESYYYTAPINTDNSLGAWSGYTISTSKYAPSVFITNSRIYQAGGIGPSTTVYNTVHYRAWLGGFNDYLDISLFGPAGVTAEGQINVSVDVKGFVETSTDLEVVGWEPADIDFDVRLESIFRTSFVMEGGKLAQWTDLSGKGHHGTQSDLSLRPTIEYDWNNSGIPAVEFFADGAIGYLTGGLNGAVSTTYEMVITVMEFGTEISSFNSIFSQTQGTSIDKEVYDGFVPAIQYGGYEELVSYIDGAVNNAPVPCSANARHIFISEYSGTTLANSVDFLPPVESIGVNTLNRYFDTYAIGSQVNAPVGRNYLDGFVSAVFVIRTPLSSKMLEQLEGYIAWNYNLVDRLPVDHTYKTAAPVVGGSEAYLEIPLPSISGVGVVTLSGTVNLIPKFELTGTGSVDAVAQVEVSPKKPEIQGVALTTILGYGQTSFNFSVKGYGGNTGQLSMLVPVISGRAINPAVGVGNFSPQVPSIQASSSFVTTAQGSILINGVKISGSSIKTILGTGELKLKPPFINGFAFSATQASGKIQIKKPVVHGESLLTPFTFNVIKYNSNRCH
ncbi:hypothetical protein GW916_00350 [bacterium]|nr:hypothetical protein [bacterium]